MHELSFAKIILLQEGIAEVVVDSGVEMTLEMVGEFHDSLLSQFKHPFSLLINKLHSYTYTFEAQLHIYSLPYVTAISVMVYNDITRATTENIIALPRETPWNIMIFHDYNLALNWLQQQQASLHSGKG